MDRAALPTAPRAARGPDIADSNKIPDGPPYTAFLGNLSYDVDREDILEFFGNKKVLNGSVCININYFRGDRYFFFWGGGGGGVLLSGFDRRVQN